jgi:hypothetical protein
MIELLLPEFGDLVSVQDFINLCNEGYVTDYDGSGYYSDGRVYWHEEEAIPSNICKNIISNDIRHRYVIWFNK